LAETTSLSEPWTRTLLLEETRQLVGDINTKNPYRTWFNHPLTVLDIARNVTSLAPLKQSLGLSMDHVAYALAKYNAYCGNSDGSCHFAVTKLVGSIYWLKSLLSVRLSGVSPLPNLTTRELEKELLGIINSGPSSLSGNKDAAVSIAVRLANVSTPDAQLVKALHEVQVTLYERERDLKLSLTGEVSNERLFDALSRLQWFLLSPKESGYVPRTAVSTPWLGAELLGVINVAPKDWRSRPSVLVDLAVNLTGFQSAESNITAALLVITGSLADLHATCFVANDQNSFSAGLKNLADSVSKLESLLIGRQALLNFLTSQLNDGTYGEVPDEKVMLESDRIGTHWDELYGSASFRHDNLTIAAAAMSSLTKIDPTHYWEKKKNARQDSADMIFSLLRHYLTEYPKRFWARNKKLDSTSEFAGMTQ